MHVLGKDDMRQVGLYMLEMVVVLVECWVRMVTVDFLVHSVLDGSKVMDSFLL